MIKANLNYRLTKNNGVPIVLLHGWGGSMDSFLFLEQHLISIKRTVINLDFLGFGASGQPSKDYTIFDYANDIKELLDDIGYSEYYLIGHSFGGRVAILLGQYDYIKKIILVDSAGVKPRRGLKYYYKIWTYKVKKKLGFNVKNAGSSDYRSLSPEFKKVFNSIVNTNLNKYIRLIKASTLIVWGEQDKDTPLYMAKYIHKHIRDSGLIVWDNCGHFSYLEKPFDFIAIVDNFLI